MDSLPRVPDLLVVNLFKLAGKVLSIRVMTIKLERLASLSSVAYALAELLKDRSVRHLEDRLRQVPKSRVPWHAVMEHAL